MLDRMQEVMEQAAGAVRAWPATAVDIYHHNDADGLSCAAILTTAFKRFGFEVHRYCLEKPYPAVLKKVFQAEGRIIIFADFAGGVAPLLADENQGRNLVLILDHHPAVQVEDVHVHNLDPDLYGLLGDRDISASTTCYLFARTLDPVNTDLAYLAVIGAVGDGFFAGGRMTSVNREALLEARRQGAVHIDVDGDAERYILKAHGHDQPIVELAQYLDILGSGGYCQGGPEIGVDVCLYGANETSDQMTQNLKKLRTRVFEDEIELLEKGGLNATKHIQWFNVHQRFTPMGVKTIGVFCQTLRDMPFIDPDKYIAGFQAIPEVVPGVGRFDFQESKASMRVPSNLTNAVNDGRAKGLNEFMPAAAGRLGGFADACHRLAAAVTVGLGRETEFINEMEKIITKDRL